MKEIQKALEIAEGWTGTEEFACEIRDLLVAALPEIEALRAENERLRALFKRVKEIADNPWKWEKAYVNSTDYAGFEVGLVLGATLYPLVHDAIGIDPAPLDCDLSGITPALTTPKESSNG